MIVGYGEFYQLNISRNCNFYSCMATRKLHNIVLSTGCCFLRASLDIRNLVDPE